MHSKNYEKFAELFAEFKQTEEIKNFISSFCEYAKEDNPLFDETRFRRRIRTIIEKSEEETTE